MKRHRTRTRLDTPASCAESATVPNGRERTSCGKFAKGNKSARGRRSAADRLRAELAAAVDGGVWNAIVARCIAQAKRGDRHAREFLASYLLGKPRLMPVPVDSFKLGKLDTAADVALAAARVAQTAASGALSLEAARELAALLEVARAAIETGELAERIKQLETRIP